METICRAELADAESVVRNYKETKVRITNLSSSFRDAVLNQTWFIHTYMLTCLRRDGKNFKE